MSRYVLVHLKSQNCALSLVSKVPVFNFLLTRVKACLQAMTIVELGEKLTQHVPRQSATREQVGFHVSPA